MEQLSIKGYTHLLYTILSVFIIPFGLAFVCFIKVYNLTVLGRDVSACSTRTCVIAQTRPKSEAYEILYILSFILNSIE